MSTLPVPSQSELDSWISWEDYHQKIEQLAALIARSQWSFDTILCIARGGLRVGDILSRIYNKPLGILSAQSYGKPGAEGRDRGDVMLSAAISMVGDRLGPAVLLVDDLADSGQTLYETTQYLEDHYRQDIESLKTATLWCKACSGFTPDYYVDFLDHNPWIHQPFERYGNGELLESFLLNRRQP